MTVPCFQNIRNFQSLRKSFSNVMVAGLLMSVSCVVFADDALDYQKNIAAIGKQIEKISQNLNANKALLKTQQDKLLAVEQEISTLSKALSNTDKKITDQQQRGKELLAQIEQLRVEQEDDIQALSSLLVSRYTNGKNNYMKMLLNQENPYAVGRLNNYYAYFSAARQEKLTKLRGQIEQTSELQDEQITLLADLESTQNQQKIQQQKLDDNKLQRENSVSELNSKVSSSSEQLEKLKQDRSRLNTLIKQIALQAEKLRKLEQERIAQEKRQAAEDAKNNKPPTIKPVVRELVEGGFIKQRGRLSYPVTGKVKTAYNSRLPESGMRAEGVFFDTNGSVSVNSIFRGRVLFADFLKGYGLLLIIDHGDDHISLYGHNELVYKNVGDVVETNEIVAKTGVTGGLKTHGLYFEIRNNATPIDPSTWCE